IGPRVASASRMRSLIFLPILFVACSSTPSGGDDAGSQNDVVQQQEVLADAPSSVTFSYTPQWSTVSAVTVWGALGHASDWTAAFLTLTNDGTGTFKGSATLPPGQYLYVFKVVGDDAAGSGAAKYARFSIDPTNSAYQDCPTASPTYDANAPNP